MSVYYLIILTRPHNLAAFLILLIFTDLIQTYIGWWC